MKVTLIQSPLIWESPKQNRSYFEEKINSISENIDLIILPEMFTTGFTMKTHLAETKEGQGLHWMQQTAIKNNCAVTGSIAVTDKGKFYNRLYWVNPDGTCLFYNKRHLFSMGKEDEFYSCGEHKIIVDYMGWKICPLVCYDLRFPIWSRNTKNNPYDLLIYVANWPEVRSYPWTQLLIARAIENQCYVAGVNRIGIDGNNLSYSGNTIVLDPRGNKISATLTNEASAETVSLSLAELNTFRTDFPVLNDGDEFNIV